MQPKRRGLLAFAGLALATLFAASLSSITAHANVLHAPFNSSLDSSVVVPQTTTTEVVPGSPPTLTWPRVGQAAVAVLGVGLVGTSPHEQPVPIASVTKMMTALVILHDHPLAQGQSGPVLTITANDAEQYIQDTAAGDSTVRVVAGERLSEYELLEALLIPSGDNIADLLATWDAGSIEGFVAKMNATAAALGLAATHYGDASGVSSSSVSTAADQAVVVAQLMEHPVIRAIVRRPRLAFPVAGIITNYNPALGVDGIVGVKSGWTTAAQSCLVTAAFKSVAHHGMLVISVALGQPGGLTNPAHVDESLLASTTKALTAYQVVASDAVVASITPAGGDVSVPLVGSSTRVVTTVWPGLTLSEKIVTASSTAGLLNATAGSIVGTLEVRSPWGVLAQIPLHLGVASTTPNASGTTG